MLKKVLVTMLSAMMVFGTVNVNCYAEAADGTVVVNTAYGEVEVPSAPTRICVLDLSVMDILDTLGLGENVVVLQWHKHYPSYLDGYYNSETIISLTSSNGGHGSTETTDEDADPYEMYYSIDADIIIGTTEKIDEDLYAILSQIAPTVALTPALEASENLYDAVCENAETIASIWGLEEEYESYISEYDEIYAQLCETVEGKSYVITNGDTENGLIQIGSAQSYSGEKSGKSEASEATEKSSENANTSGKSNKKNNTANVDTFLSQLGMTNISENVSEDAAAETIAAAMEAGTSKEDAAAMAIAAINEAAPDGVFVFNYSYGSLEEIQEAGFDITGLDELTCPAGFISIELTYTSGGLHAVTSMLDLMSEMFLG